MFDDRNSKITPGHLARKALVYVRQSSEKQVQENHESRRLQYRLRERAVMLGWREVEVLDEDLGVSAGPGSTRAGFEKLIATVALAEVGIIFSIEASRLSRTDKDWCRLLELCGVFDTLIADAQNIYDLKLPDDQLLLGIKGTLSVMELNIMKMRMLRGAQEKAARGELKKILPAGYIYDGTGKVVLDPDRRIREAIGLVFKKYREFPSTRQLYLWFAEEGIELPVKQLRNGGQSIEWQTPRPNLVRDIIRNPIFAGAYAFGRRRTEMKWKNNSLVKRTGRFLPPEQWKVLIQDHHEGYISWEEYEANLKKMQNSALQIGAEAGVAVVREGQGLLNPLLRCGRCGRKMHVRYWGKAGTAARYLCRGDFDSGGQYCLGFGSSLVDRRFSREVLNVIEPMTISASLKAVEEVESHHDQTTGIFETQLEDARYAAKRAFEQYNAVDARNRLVADELEKRWNEKLETVRELEERLREHTTDRKRLTREEKDEIRALAKSFPRVWEDFDCPASLKKQLIRTIVKEIIVNQEGDRGNETLHFVIHWKGGVHTEFRMPKPQSSVMKKTTKEDLELIRELAQRHDDGEIARVLNKLGRKTAKGNRWRADRVKTTRRKYGIVGPAPRDTTEEIIGIESAAEYCKVSSTTIRKLAAKGILKFEQIAPYAPWVMKKRELDAEPIRSICEHLRRTGKLKLNGVCLENQPLLFPLKSAKLQGGVL